ncbi:winged helix-turn-helix domain-containing protein [Humidisolicoccus flavus]|uniref:winged helix-turn-helix domain-containing protein n=1 Tax=Humidisolicoccus flavus TaxID=3111414 RepID=UPI003246E6DF
MTLAISPITRTPRATTVTKQGFGIPSHATRGNLALAPQQAPSAAPAAAPAAQSHVQAVPASPEARGFVLYVGLGEEASTADGVRLATLVNELKRLTQNLAPSAQTHAAVALAPAGAGGRDIDVVRRALQDPSLRQETPEAEPNLGVVIDLSRKRVSLGDDVAPLTYKEFELLQFIVLREGRTVERQEIIDTIWSEATEENAPNERTIDVHVRRLRLKLGAYSDIVRTVRGVGYRFDRHADVSIVTPATPSFDL